ncbi:MAG: response regulator [Firmicutes bacterium]|nr:response regulator [Bacillota bacterium]
MEIARQIFLKETLEKIPKVQQALDTLLKDPGNKTCLNILYMFFHSIYGTGSTIGFTEVVKPAKIIENKLFDLLESGQAPEKEYLQKLKEAFDQFVEKFNDLKETRKAVPPEELEQPLLKAPRKEILIVDDDAAMVDLLVRELNKRNFGATGAGDAAGAKKILERYRPDLIILDIVMPGSNGLELLKELRADPRFDWTPIFILSSKSSPTEIIDGIKTGADDYILKPFDVDDLVARIEAKSSRMDKLYGMTVRDPLTGVFSRGYFMERFNEETERFHRQKKVFALIMCDLDFFKNINDQFGHQTGDYVLQKFAAFLARNLRNVDIVGRYGGEEFVILLPDTGAQKAYTVMERLRQEWEKVNLADPNSGVPIRITFSAGISEPGADGDTEKDIIKAADKALYLAKETGRNKTVLAGGTGGGAPPQHKILVVDDSTVSRVLLTNELKNNYHVFVAKNGADALNQIEEIRPHLVITDLVMPVMDGIELTKKIRQDPDNKYIKIIALTSSSQKKVVLEALQAGVDDYIVKPFDLNGLKSRIKRLLKTDN